MRSCAVLLILAWASVAEAQPATAPHAGAVFAGASVGGQHLGQLPADRTCAAPGNGGIFCGGVTGSVPIVTGSAGVFIARSVSVGVEVSASKAHSAPARYDQHSHVDYNVTTATFEHSGERAITAFVRPRIAVGDRGLAIEPAFGWMWVHATDSLLDQVNVAGASTHPRVTRSVVDVSTRRNVQGVTAGIDLSAPAKRGVAFIASARLRWIVWPPTTTFYYMPGELPVPVAAGRLSYVFTLGIRWTHGDRP